jgi:uncharacterized protein YegP (UPF0339 family)
VKRPRFEIKQGVHPGNGEGYFWWRLVGGNGEVMGQSESYTTHADAVRGAKAARRAAYLATIEQPD